MVSPVCQNRIGTLDVCKKHGVCLDMYHLTSRCAWDNCTTDGVSRRSTFLPSSLQGFTLFCLLQRSGTTMLTDSFVRVQGHRARYVNRMKAQMLLNTLCTKSESVLDQSILAHIQDVPVKMWDDGAPPPPVRP